MRARILLVGCGRMGGAMLSGWLDHGVTASQVLVVEPAPARAESVRRERGVTVHASAEAIDPAFRPDVVAFAVKPQNMDEVAPLCRRYAGPGTVFLSIAAGKTIAYFERHLGAGAAIVRAMPNAPAAVGRGMTVACPNPAVTATQRTLCDNLLSAIGEVAWIEDEALLDPVTAVSGGGPAYVFLLVECLAEAGVAAGLPEDLAQRIARATVSGSGALLSQSSEPPEALREAVANPGGTTAEALKVLMADDGWQPLVTRAIAAATARSRELAG